MQVDTNVSESDIGGVKEGNKATFTVDAFPKRVFEGEVSQVRQSPQTVQNVVTFDAVISVANQDLALKPGMTASTRILTDQRTDVMRVPNQALRYLPGGLVNTAAPTLPSLPVLPTPTCEGSSLWVLREDQPELSRSCQASRTRTSPRSSAATSDRMIRSSSLRTRAPARPATVTPTALLKIALRRNAKMQRPAQTPVIQAANITKTFVSGDVKVHALRGIKLVVSPASSSPSWDPLDQASPRLCRSSAVSSGPQAVTISSRGLMCRRYGIPTSHGYGASVSVSYFRRSICFPAPAL